MPELLEARETLEVSAAKNRVFEVLDGEFYHGKFFQDTEDGQMPDFIGLADKIITDLIAAGVTIPTDLKESNRG